jgi:hypothetical protein
MESMQQILKFIDSNNVNKIVIDLRINPGGNFESGRRLIAELKKRQKNGKTYVLIGRRTGSAAVVNAMDMQKDLNAVLVGEPTGEKPNTYGDLEFMYLPNSGLSLGYSSNYYKFRDKEEDALMPDYLIVPNWEDYANGRDATLEWILASGKKE